MSGRSHTHVVWRSGNRSGVEDLLAVRRRIFVCLEERFPKPACERAGKGGIGGRDKGIEEREGGGLYGRKKAEPFLLVQLKKPEPAIELGKRDGEALTETLSR